MNIKDGYNSKKVTFGMQDSLNGKIDKLTSMMSKLMAKDNNQDKQFNRYIKVDGEDNLEIIMIRVIIKIDIDQIMEIEGHSEVEVSMDRIIGEDHITSIIIEMTLEETILEKCEITELKVLEGGIEGITEMPTYKEVEVGLGKDNIQVNLAEMTEIVVVGQDQVLEPVLI